MSIPTRQRVSPQARGRGLAREGRQLWQELGSVKRAAAELLNRHRDIPSIQTYRYACGLSQDQAAARYNEVAEHQTSLGGTTINAWEAWARGRGAGSPPPFSSLLILAIAYGRGPLGVTEEDISPGDLVSEAYERLAPEEQLSLKRFADGRWPSRPVEVTRAHFPAVSLRPLVESEPIIGRDFNLTVPTVNNGNPEIRAFSMPNPRPGQLLDLTWEAFGFGIERLIRQIKSLGQRIDADICFGINEAGLIMATSLASARFGRCAIGYLKCNKIRDDITLDSNSFYPTANEAPTIFICDFEVKHADVVGFIAREVRSRYPRAQLYLAVFGAMTKGSDLEVDTFDDLTGARIMRAANFRAVFIAGTMSPPGIEPPLELR